MPLVNLIWKEQAELRLLKWRRRSGARRLRDEFDRVFMKCRGACVYCGTIRGPFQVDHAVPKMRGGTDDERNLVLACRSCNERKALRTAAEFGHPEVQAEPQPAESYGMFNYHKYRR